MKKVKITVLRKTLIEDLAKEYGTEGLTKCPMLQEGQVFYADYAKPKGFCDEAWRLFISMYSLWLMEPVVSYSIMAIGFVNREWLSVVVTMVCVRLSLSWKQPTKRRKLIILQ